MSRTCLWSLLCVAVLAGIADAQTVILRKPGTVIHGESQVDPVALIDSPLMTELRFGATPAMHASVAEQVQRQRELLIQSLQQLQDLYCKAGMLDEAVAVRDQLRRLQADAAVTLSTVPSTSNTTDMAPYQLRGRNGEVHYAEVTGTTTGTVWGSGPYTDDSDIGTAAVHSGHLKVGERQVVAFRILPGQASYASSSTNGVRTLDYPAWGGSFEVVGAGLKGDDFRADKTPLEAELVTVFLTGRTFGNVWGNDIYTADSDLATAAVHAGVLKAGESGLVQVELLAGQPSYLSATRHGVTSQAWGQWSGSIRLRKLIRQ